MSSQNNLTEINAKIPESDIWDITVTNKIHKEDPESYRNLGKIYSISSISISCKSSEHTHYCSEVLLYSKKLLRHFLVFDGLFNLSTDPNFADKSDGIFRLQMIIENKNMYIFKDLLDKNLLSKWYDHGYVIITHNNDNMLTALELLELALKNKLISYYVVEKLSDYISRIETHPEIDSSFYEFRERLYNMTLKFKYFFEKINNQIKDEDSEEVVKQTIFGELSKIGSRYPDQSDYYNKIKQTFCWKLPSHFMGHSAFEYNLLITFLEYITDPSLQFFPDSRRVLSKIKGLLDCQSISLKDKYQNRILTLLEAPNDPGVQKDLKIHLGQFINNGTLKELPESLNNMDIKVSPQVIFELFNVIRELNLKITDLETKSN